jgi:hypothetical protein
MSTTTDPDDETEPPDEERRLRRALRQIRHEGWKVAAIYAVVDAALVTLLVNLAVTVFGGVPGLPTRLPIPRAVRRTLRETAGVSLAEPTVSSAAVVGLVVGVAVLVADGALRMRRPLVERFEAANPALRESLRTARDAVARDRRSPMARRLYESVLADLERASSVGLLDMRRLAVTVLLIGAVSVVTIQVAVVDVSLAGLGGAGPDAGTGGTDADYAGLQDGSAILGEPEDVPEGSEELDATIDTGGAGDGDGTEAESAASYEDSGFDGSETVESQRAGFTERERLEDAALIREYNLRIRQETNDE